VAKLGAYLHWPASAGTAAEGTTEGGRSEGGRAGGGTLKSLGVELAAAVAETVAGGWYWWAGTARWPPSHWPEAAVPRPPMWQAWRAGAAARCDGGGVSAAYASPHYGNYEKQRPASRWRKKMKEGERGEEEEERRRVTTLYLRQGGWNSRRRLAHGEPGNRPRGT
jgi:hypothetical protein